MTLIRIRGDTAANWTSVNPVLAYKEIAAELDTRKFKIGDGSTAWNSLAYAGGGTTYTSSGGITLSGADFRLSNMAANTLKGNNTGSAAAPADLTVSQVKTLLSLGSVDNTADAAKNVLSATKLTTSRTLAGTGDVAWSGSFDGSANLSVTTTIQAGTVTLAKMANVATATVFYRKTAGTGAPEVQTLATLKTDLALTGTNSGDQTITLTGDATGSGTGSFATALATVNTNVGSFGSATQVATFTVNGKGLTTAAANVTITPAVGSITGLGTSVATALAVAVGSAGAFVTFNGALGTPSSGTLTNCTFPTLNQNTTGSAAKLTTARTIAGNSFDGTANITIADTDLTGAAWVSWTPTWTNVTIGNAVIAAFYKQIGKTVVATIHVTIGSTTVVTGSPIQFTLPVAGKGSLGDHQGFDPGLLYDSSAGLLCAGLVQIAAAGLSTASIKAQTVSGTNVVISNSSSTVPFTWAVSDEIVFSFFYEAA